MDRFAATTAFLRLASSSFGVASDDPDEGPKCEYKGTPCKTETSILQCIHEAFLLYSMTTFLIKNPWSDTVRLMVAFEIDHDSTMSKLAVVTSPACETGHILAYSPLRATRRAVTTVTCSTYYYAPSCPPGLRSTCSPISDILI